MAGSINSRNGFSRLTLQTQLFRRAKAGYSRKWGDSWGLTQPTAPGDARAQALFHLLCGEVDRGADWAERAINEGDLAMRTVYIRFVACKQLRASNRWPKIAKMINLPQTAETPGL
jgi:hypothetical protein